MSEYDFQDFCCELFEQEPRIASCEVYGKRGETQKGVDLFARTSSGGVTEVGQCKCTHRFPPAEIRKATSAFLAHWDFWAAQQVRRFILFVACDLNSAHQQDEITCQQKLFFEKGIRYEAWSARRIAKQLKPRREIANEYFDADVVDRLCGRLSVSSPPPSPAHLAIVDEALARQLESMTSLVSRAVSTELEAIRSVYREGRAGEALRRLESLLGEPSLPAAVRSELLVLAARAELDRQGPDAARKLLARVPKALPSAARLTALVEYRATGLPDHALALLSPLNDLASRQLAAAVLLEVGRLAAAASVLHELPAEPADPETLRLSAFLHLLEGRLQQAQLAIAEALELEPRWASLRWAAGMIAYHHSISPALPRLHLAPWPEPINWHFVRRDDTSVTRLNEAALHFGDLLRATDPPPAERCRLETWYLASLANNPERQAEADTFCRTILEDQPAHAPAVLWAVARNFDVDLKQPRRSLEALVRAAQHPEYEQVLALMAIYLSHKQHRKALALIDQERPLFEEAHASRLWAYWRVLALASAKRDAAPFLDQLAHAGKSFEVRQARAVALSERAKATEDPQPLLRHLAESFDATADPAFLFAACAVAAEHSDWTFVAARREALIELIGTPDAVHLAAFSAYRTGQYQVCREILDGHRDLFPHARLPTDLRELRVATTRQLGALSEAIAEAEALAHDDPSTRHLVNLATVYLDSGDLKALVLTARRLLGRPDLLPRDALRIARLVHLEDLALARALLGQATATPVADALVGEAFDLAYRLGLERGTKPLLERVVELARTSQAGLRAVGLPDLLQLFKDRRHHLEDVDEAYSRAAIPIHLVSAETGSPLADLFHSMLADNESDPRPRDQGFLLIRHGGRPLAEFSEPTRWRLHLDITAVLLAAHFDVLDKVESIFSPLRVADDLIPALLEMRDNLSPAQPDHLAASEAVLELLDSHKIKLLGEAPKPAASDLPDLSALGMETSELLAAAVAANGVLVQFLPLTDRDGTLAELSPSVMARISGPSAVLAALQQSGAIPGARYEQARSKLGPSETEHPGTSIAGTSKALFCARGIAQRLARLGILEVSSRTFDIQLHPREADHLRNKVSAGWRAATTAAWLTALVERIRQGIAAGTYELVVALDQPAAEPAAPRALRSLPLRCLQTLLLCQLAPGDVLWIDDRFANSYVARDQTPIVGINEVLRVLVAAGALRTQEHYATLARMRAANLRFIPLDADELVYQLAQSQLDDSGGILETHELRTLRTAVAAAVERFSILQLPTLAAMTEPGRYEVAAVINLHQAVREAIRGLWNADIPTALAEARSDWLIANLHYDHRTLAEFLGRPAAQDEVQSASLALSALVSEGFAVQAAPGETLSRRREYFAWLERQVLAPCLYANPAVLVATTEFLKRFLRDIRSEPHEGMPPAAWYFHLAVFVRDLPLRLRNEIGNDQEFMASLDLTRTPTAAIGGHTFDRQELMEAIGQAVNGRTAKIAILHSRAMARFEPAADNAIALTVRKKQITVPLHDEFLLLIDSVARRKELLGSHPEWFDCPVADRDAAVAAIATEENLSQRLYTAERWKNRSAAHFYSDLRETLTTERQLSYDQLIPPHLDGLLEHLRLERASTLPSDALVSALGAGADRLVIEEGPAAAVRRLWSLPIPLPPSVVAALPASTQERGVFLDSLSTDALTPLARSHLIRLHLADPGGTDSHGRAESLTSSLLSPSALHEWALFRRLLQWTLWQFELRDTVTWSPHARLLAAWLHADKVLHTLLSAYVDAEELLNRFPSAPRRISPASFRITEHATRDAAHPDQASLPRLMASSIAYAWEGAEPGESLGDIRSGLQGLISVDSNGGLLPIPEILRDLTMAQNRLGTYLDRDLGEGLQSIVDASLAAHLRSVVLQHHLEAAGQAIDAEPNSSVWAVVGAILGNLEPSPATRERLASAVERMSFRGLLEQGLPVALTVISAASQQARYFQQATRDHLKQELVNLAAQVPSLEPAVRIPLANLLLVAMFNGAVAGEADLTRAAGEFAHQVLLLLDAWPGLGPLIAAGLREICDRLSLSQQSRFAHLLLRLRAA